MLAFQKYSLSASIALALMQRAKYTVVSAAGKSANCPNGETSAMRLAVGDENVAPKCYPSSALRECAFWTFDEPNGSEMDLGLSTVDKAVTGT